MIKPFAVLVLLFATKNSFAQPSINRDSLNPVLPVSSIIKKDSSLIMVNDKATLKLYPNPATNKILLDVTGFTPGMATVKIIDSKGKVVRSDERLLINGTEQLNMFLSLQAGMYFISISEKNKIVKKKLVIL